MLQILASSWESFCQSLLHYPSLIWADLKERAFLLPLWHCPLECCRCFDMTTLFLVPSQSSFSVEVSFATVAVAQELNYEHSISTVRVSRLWAQPALLQLASLALLHERCLAALDHPYLSLCPDLVASEVDCARYHLLLTSPHPHLHLHFILELQEAFVRNKDQAHFELQTVPCFATFVLGSLLLPALAKAPQFNLGLLIRLPLTPLH